MRSLAPRPAARGARPARAVSMRGGRVALAGSGGALLPAGVALVALAGLALAIGIGIAPVTARRLLPWAVIVAIVVPVVAASLARRRASAAWWWRGALLLVTLVGAILRLRGISFGLPYVPHPDEPAIVNIAQRMLTTGDLDPQRFIYPSLYLYLQALTFALHLGWGFTQGLYTGVGDLPPTTDFITTAPGIYLWGRTLTAILSTGAIPLTYVAGRRLYGPQIGLLAATLLAFSPSMIDDAHLITVDAPVAFFTILAFCWIAALPRASDAGGQVAWGPILRAGLGIGLAAATKYNAALIALPLLIAPLLRGLGAPWRVWLGALLAAGATFLAVTPFAIPRLPTFLDDTAGVIAHYRFWGHAGFEGTENWRYFATYLWQTLGPTFPLALVGFVVMAYRARRADLLLLPFPLLYYAGLAGLRVNFTRNLMALYPFLALAGAIGLLAAANALAALAWRVRAGGHPPARRRGALVALVLLPPLIAWPAAIAGRLDNLRAVTDSRVVAERWMADNLPRDRYWLVDAAPQQWARYGNACSTAPSDCGVPTSRPPAWYPAHGFRYLLLLDRPPSDPSLSEADAAWYWEAQARFAVVRTFPGPAGPALILLDTGLPVSALTQPSEAVFGDDAGGIALLGHEMGSAAGLPPLGLPDPAVPRRYTPGDTVRLSLLWRAAGRPADSYRVFVHLRDVAGRIVAQHDARPQGDTYATNRWRDGEVVLDYANLALAPGLPAGRYTVVVGLAPLDRSRLSVRPTRAAAPLPGDELFLAAIEVAR